MTLRLAGLQSCPIQNAPHVFAKPVSVGMEASLFVFVMTVQSGDGIANNSFVYKISQFRFGMLNVREMGTTVDLK